MPNKSLSKQKNIKIHRRSRCQFLKTTFDLKCYASGGLFLFFPFKFFHHFYSVIHLTTQDDDARGLLVLIPPPPLRVHEARFLQVYNPVFYLDTTETVVENHNLDEFIDAASACSNWSRLARLFGNVLCYQDQLGRARIGEVTQSSLEIQLP